MPFKIKLYDQHAKVKTEIMTLTELPKDIHIELFRHLDNVTATCFGLTCKAFWRLHRVANGQVWLWENSPRGLQTFGKPLYELLETWMLSGLVYGESFFPGKFVVEEMHIKAKKAHLQDVKDYLTATTARERKRIWCRDEPCEPIGCP
jgi:hypothetical protein